MTLESGLTNETNWDIAHMVKYVFMIALLLFLLSTANFRETSSFKWPWGQ